MKVTQQPEPPITENALRRSSEHIAVLMDARFRAVEGTVVREAVSAADRVADLDRLTDAKFVRIQAMMDASADKVALALSASDKAVSKAEIAADKRIETLTLSLSELRSQLHMQASTFMPRSESLALHSANAARNETNNAGISLAINELKERLDRNEGRSTGFSASGGILVASVGLIATLIGIVSAVLVIAH